MAKTTPFRSRLACALSLCILAACSSDGRPGGEPLCTSPVGTPVEVLPPLGLPPIPAPEGGPLTKETIALGEKLFFSTLLSVDRTLSCAHCHDPLKGFADGQQHSTGVWGKKGIRNAPSVRNAAYNVLQFWDGRAGSLEEQASGPVMNPIEMAHTVEGVEAAVNSDPELRRMFVEAFGPAPDPSKSPVSIERIAHAIAAYERTLLAADSPFDRFYYGKDSSALSPAARRGFDVFRNPRKGNCAVCHTVGEGYALFTDDKFHNLGVGVDPEGELTDLGRYTVTGVEGDQGRFRTPTLRNIAETAPYMHDGSLKTLKDVVDFYVGGGNWNPWRDELIRPLTHLTREERTDLVAFLESLTGVSPPEIVPKP